MKSPETDSCTYGNSVYNKSGISNLSQISFLINVGATGEPFEKKIINFDQSFTLHTKMSKWVKQYYSKIKPN